MKLTKPQQNLLDRLKRMGTMQFNGRMRKPIEALAKAGLVRYWVRPRPDALHGRHTLTYVVTANE